MQVVAEYEFVKLAWAATIIKKYHRARARNSRYRYMEVRWQTTIQAAAKYEFVVSNKSVPCYLLLAPRHSRLRNSIKTSVHATLRCTHSSVRWNAGNLVVSAAIAEAAAAAGSAGTKTELIPVTFPNRANYQSRSLNHLPAPGYHMQYTCRQ